MLQVDPSRRGTCRHHPRSSAAPTTQVARLVNGRWEILMLIQCLGEGGQPDGIYLHASLLYTCIYCLFLVRGVETLARSGSLGVGEFGLGALGMLGDAEAYLGFRGTGFLFCLSFVKAG